MKFRWQSFGITSDERARLILACCLYGVVHFGLALARAGRDALFYLEVGSSYLPLMFAMTAIVSFGANEIYSRAVGVLAQHVLYLRTVTAFLILASAVCVLVFLREDAPSGTWAKWILYGGIFAIVESIAIILIVATANYVNDSAVFDLNEIKRLSPLYISAGHLGGVVSGILSLFYLSHIGIAWLFVAWVISLCAALVIGQIIRARYYGKRILPPVIADCGPGSLSTIGVIWNSPYLRAFVLVTILNFYLGTAFEWNLARIATLIVKARIGDNSVMSPIEAESAIEGDLLAYLGEVYIGGGVCALVFQLFFMNSIVHHLGVARANFGAPLLLGVGATAIFFKVDSIFAAIVARSSFLLAENAFNQTLIRFVYNVIPERNRIRVQAFIESNVITITVALSGLLLIVFSLLGVPMLYFAFGNVAGFAAMLILTNVMKTEYTREARENYNRMSSGNRETLFAALLATNTTDSDSFFEFLRKSSDWRAVVLLLRIISQDKSLAHRHYFIRQCLQDDRLPVQQAAMRSLAHIDADENSIQQLLDLIHRPNHSDTLALALRTLSGILKDDSRRIEFLSFLDSSDPKVMSSAVALLWSGGMDAADAVMQLYKSLKVSTEPHDRVREVCLLGELGKTRDLLDRFHTLESSDNVRNAELWASYAESLGRLSPTKEVVDALCQCLQQPAAYLAAMSSLALHASDTRLYLVERFVDSSNTLRVRGALAEILAQIPPESNSRLDPVTEALASTYGQVDNTLKRAIAKAISARSRNWPGRVQFDQQFLLTQIQSLLNEIEALRSSIGSLAVLANEVNCAINLIYKRSEELKKDLTTQVFLLLGALLPTERIEDLYINLTSQTSHADAIEALENLPLSRPLVAEIRDLVTRRRLIRSDEDPQLMLSLSIVVGRLQGMRDFWMRLVLAQACKHRGESRIDFLTQVIGSTDAPGRFTAGTAYMADQLLRQVERIADLQFFRQLPIQFLFEFVEAAESRWLQKGDEIYCTDDNDSRLVVVLSGTVEFRLLDSDDEEGVWVRSAPLILNSAAVLEVRLPGSRVTAFEGCEVLEVEIPRMQDLTDLEPALLRALVGELSSEIALFYQQVQASLSHTRRIETRIDQLLASRLAPLDSLAGIGQRLDCIMTQLQIVRRDPPNEQGSSQAGRP